MQDVHTHHRFEVLVKDVHNHLYANANVRTNEAIATEVAKILLALVHASAKGVGSVSILSSGERAAAVRSDPEVVHRLSAEVADLFASMNAELDRYPEGTVIELDEASTAYVRARFDGVLFSAVERDWLGDAMEVFRSLDAKRLGGQFFTDQRVTQLAIDLLEFDPDNGDDFVDICAGTGGFLLAAARRLATQGSADRVHEVLGGIEVDPHLRQVANGSLSMLCRSGNVVHVGDSLASPDSWSVSLRRRVVPGTHRCLASNPPFGQKITIKDESILQQYDLARRWKQTDDGWLPSKALAPRPPDILFIERNLRLLEPGVGRLALVTPYQVLSGPQLAYVREWILRSARVLAIVDLPSDTFQPWTGTKTSLMVLQRRQEALPAWDPSVDQYDVFMGQAEHIGHDRRGIPVVAEDGSILTDLPEIGSAYAAARAGRNPTEIHAGSFLASSQVFSADNDLRLNAAFHRPSAGASREKVAQIAARKGWRLGTVGEVAHRIFFPTRFKRQYIAPGPDAVPFLGGAQISQLIPTTEKYLSKEITNLDELLVEPGWILVTRSGSTGIVSSVPESWAGCAMSEHVIRIIPNSELVDPGYLEAYLRSAVGQELLSSGIFGSVIDEITPEHVANLPLPLPPESEAMPVVAAMSAARLARDEAIRGIDAAVAALDGLAS